MNTIATITSLIANIDKRLNEIINSILHHPNFQALESAWRSVHNLLIQIHAKERRVKIYCLQLTFAELRRDLLDAADFDQSSCFQKIYSNAFDMPGGKPFGLWIGDYAFSLTDRFSLQILKHISDIAAAAFCPFVSSVSLRSMGIDDLHNWHRLQDFDFLNQSEFKNWQKLRESPNARFVSLVLPSLLLRQPYDQSFFYFKEEVSSTKDCLWGNPAYALAAVMIQAFSEYGWFDFTQGEPFAGKGAGWVQHYSGRAHTKESEFKELGQQLYITEEQEWSLNKQGVMALFSKQYDKAMIFYYMPTIKKALPQKQGTSSNTEIDHLLPYLLCVSRFAQYLKIICRDLVGAFTQPVEVERYLSDWIYQYCAGNDDLALSSFGQYPLKEAKIKVYRSQGLRDHYRLKINLCPRINLQGVDATFVLFSDIKLKG